MASQLIRTCALQALSLLTILPVAGILLRVYVADVFPQCRGTIERSPGYVGPRAPGSAAYAPLGVDRGGFSLHLDTAVEPLHGRVTRAKIVRREVDTNGATRECGGVVLDDRHVSSAGGALWPQPDGTYLYVDNLWRAEGSVLRTIERPTRHLQVSRVVARRHLAMIAALFAMVALGIAALRARKAILYATKLHAWVEARLDARGRIASDSGEMHGVIAGSAPFVAGPVLVCPNVSEKRDVYRDIPIIARRHVALGSHARWSGATMRRLRDVRVLAVVGMASCGMALLASILGT